MGTLNLVAMGRIMGQWESGLEAYQLDLGSGWGDGYPLFYSSFPYTVPAGCIYRVHAMDFTCKFPYDFTTHRTCYFQLYAGSTVSAHHPYREFQAFDLPAGFVINGMVMNGMQETQNMEFFVMGDLRAVNEAELLTLRQEMPTFPAPMILDAGTVTKEPPPPAPPKKKKWWDIYWP